MRLIEPYVTDLMILVVNQRDLIGFLEKLQREILVNVWPRLGPALVGWTGKDNAGTRHVAEFLYRRRRLGLEDRIGVVTHQLRVIAESLGRPRAIRNSGGSGGQRLGPGKRRMPPHP